MELNWNWLMNESNLEGLKMNELMCFCLGHKYNWKLYYDQMNIYYKEKEIRTKPNALLCIRCDKRIPTHLFAYAEFY